MNKFLLVVLVLVSSCTDVPMTDRVVVDRDEDTYFMNAGNVMVPMTTYVLYSRDNMKCEVERDDYRLVKNGTLFSCQWEEQ